MSEDTNADAEVVVELQKELRPELKEPMGPVYTDADELLSAAAGPLIAVGDVVTYHLVRADRLPHVALVDGRTERRAVDDDVREAVDGNAFDRHVRVGNPPATLTADLLGALGAAIDRATDGETTILTVDGEEDLAALPAIAAAPEGAAVVYGQPDEGMVLVTVDAERRATVRNLLGRMRGDAALLWAELGVDGD